MGPPAGKAGHTKPIETEAAASIPVDSFRNTTLFALHDLHQACGAMGNRMFTHLNSDVASAHLLRDRGGCAGTKKRVEDKISGIGGHLDDAAHQPFGLWRQEYILTKQLQYLLLCFLCVSHFLIWPESLGRDALLHFRQEALDLRD